MQLMANPEIHAQFDGWALGCTGTGTCLVTLGSPTYVTASFSIKPD